MRKVIFSGLVFAALLTLPAEAGCNPPPPGLTKDAWYRECAAVLQQTYRQGFNGQPYPAPYSVFVDSVYAVYWQNSHGIPQGAYGPAPMAPCSMAGQTFCPSTGWLLRCNGSVWMTGSERCR